MHTAADIRNSKSTVTATSLTNCVQAPVLLSQEKVHALVSMPTSAHVLLVSNPDSGLLLQGDVFCLVTR